jgi:hypothetical protein
MYFRQEMATTEGLCPHLEGGNPEIQTPTIPEGGWIEGGLNPDTQGLNPDTHDSRP